MKIYVAGKWKEREKIKEIMTELVELGHTITCDWTTHEKQDLSHTYALEDETGVADCDVLLAYMPNQDHFYKGAWIEVGMAIALDKLVIICGYGVNSVFLSHPNVYNYVDLYRCIETIEDIRKGFTKYDDLRTYRHERN